jgi:hypothetical protein
MFEPVFMRLALVASIATGVSLGVMGVYLVIRRVVFLGLVVARNGGSSGDDERSGYVCHGSRFEHRPAVTRTRLILLP